MPTLDTNSNILKTKSLDMTDVKQEKRNPEVNMKQELRTQTKPDMDDLKQENRNPEVNMKQELRTQTKPDMDDLKQENRNPEVNMKQELRTQTKPDMDDLKQENRNPEVNMKQELRTQTKPDMDDLQKENRNPEVNMKQELRTQTKPDMDDLKQENRNPEVNMKQELRTQTKPDMDDLKQENRNPEVNMKQELRTQTKPDMDDLQKENRNPEVNMKQELRTQTKQDMDDLKQENRNPEVNMKQELRTQTKQDMDDLKQENRNPEVNMKQELRTQTKPDMDDLQKENRKQDRNLETNIKNMIGSKMIECSECRKDERKLTEIQRFYDGKNVMITGATGFLGKVLMEKLLRSCPGVENIYLLVRQKRGKDIYTRIEEIFDDPVFDRLKEECPKFRHKVVVVPGDCEAVGLGLSLGDRQILTEKVNVVFHSAATVKFDEHLRAALATNVRAPLHLLRLARDMRDLSVFMHVSTAYSNSHLYQVRERFYPCEASCDELEAAIDKLTDEQIDQMLPTILGSWPNTYTFTKALAEKELRANAGDLPIGIFRPAIVTSTAKEPLVCWLDNMYGPTGVAIGTVTGILRTLQCDEAVTADIVPVDMVVNCLMVAAANVHKTYKRSPPAEPPIFNYVSSVENRITWGQFMKYNLASIDHNPFSNAVWYVSLTLHRSARMNQLYIIFLHLLPGALVDALAVCLGRQPKMLKVYRKIHKFSSVLSYFCTREIQFCNRNIREMWESTPEDDKQIFPFSMSEVSWEQYFQHYLVGIRRYMFKESDDTLPQARIKWRRLYYLHQLVRLIFSVLAIYTLWSVLAALW